MKTTMVALVMLGAAAHAGDLAGHYYLQNVREMGSELLLKPDGTFDYMRRHRPGASAAVLPG